MNRSLLLSSQNGWMKKTPKHTPVIAPSTGVTTLPDDTSSSSCNSRMAEREHRDESHNDIMDEKTHCGSESMISSGDTQAVTKSVKAEDITRFDVVYVGRGGHGWQRYHCGYVYYRRLIEKVKPVFGRSDVGKKEKMTMSRWIVGRVRALGGRFLERDKATGLFEDLGDSIAQMRTSMALRDRRHWKTVFEAFEKQDEEDHPLEHINLQDFLRECDLLKTLKGESILKAMPMGGVMAEIYNAKNNAAMAEMMSARMMGQGLNTNPLRFDINTTSHKELLMKQCPQRQMLGSSSVTERAKAMGAAGGEVFSSPSSTMLPGPSLAPHSAMICNNAMRNNMKMMMMQKQQQQRQMHMQLQRQRQLQMKHQAFKPGVGSPPPLALEANELIERQLLQQEIQQNREMMMIQQARLARLEAHQEQLMMQQQHRLRMEMQQAAEIRLQMDLQESQHLMLQQRQMQKHRTLQEEAKFGGGLKDTLDCGKAYGEYARRVLETIRAEDNKDGAADKVEVVEIEDE